ncbi:MAG: hypothetical protein N3D20_02850, partial [Candidatus Pacearchaeota archaeon]|nr:hypothetical protein [Candidatus Pacearchaeota archaeon]
AKYSVALSYYYFDGIEELYPKDKWIYLKKETTKHSYGITKNLKIANKPKAEELLILNYEPKRSLYNRIIK